MARTQFVTRYDFRAPGADAATRQEIFARAVEQAAYVEQHGQDAIMVSEHHASDDGYLPSPLLVASAFAAVTSTHPDHASRRCWSTSTSRSGWPRTSPCSTT